MPRPRDLLVQWVPHGFGYRGMNVHFARWVARRAAKGDRVDVMVHEPFVDYFGGSWIQPARALVQRHMTRTVLRAARRVWMSIPGWEARLLPMVRDASVLRVLPVPGTIPVDRSMAAVAEVRRRALGSASRLVGYFGAGGPYAEAALQAAVRDLTARRRDIAFLCIGRGSEEVAARLNAPQVMATGAIDLTSLSHHLSACDVLLQPYVDGVSGRRTTTISALEHGIPVATTFGALSEPFWKDTEAVAVVPSESAASAGRRDRAPAVGRSACRGAIRGRRAVPRALRARCRARAALRGGLDALLRLPTGTNGSTREGAPADRPERALEVAGWQLAGFSRLRLLRATC